MFAVRCCFYILWDRLNLSSFKGTTFLGYKSILLSPLSLKGYKAWRYVVAIPQDVG